ncbi:MAG TPA: hypothetical protein VD815_07575 [Candidatus Saccharimonadales bacterium]|nr:hypothetical protein [Candidatus Saccharimonadales bacterium]
MTDAGLTLYRAIKKIKSIWTWKKIGIIGISALGSYAVQYAKILTVGPKYMLLIDLTAN